jgi:hypothetical protein
MGVMRKTAIRAMESPPSGSVTEVVTEKTIQRWIMPRYLGRYPEATSRSPMIASHLRASMNP